jgi:chromosome segregation ATPase
LPKKKYSRTKASITSKENQLEKYKNATQEEEKRQKRTHKILEEIQPDLDELQIQIDEVESEKRTLKPATKYMKQLEEIAALGESIKSVEKQQLNLELKVNQTKSEFSRILADKKSLAADALILSTASQALLAEKGDIQKTVDGEEVRRQALQQNIQQIQNTSITNIRSIRFRALVSQCQSQLGLSHVLGMLCDLGCVNRSQLVGAVNAIIGSALNSTVVVDTRKTAVQVLAHFKRAKVFVDITILNEMNSSQPRKNIQHGGVCLLDCIRPSKPAILRVFQRLLGNWCAFKTSAECSSFQTCTRRNSVSFEGEKFYGGGELAWTSQKSSSVSDCGLRFDIYGGRVPHQMPAVAGTETRTGKVPDLKHLENTVEKMQLDYNVLVKSISKMESKMDNYTTVAARQDQRERDSRRQIKGREKEILELNRKLEKGTKELYSQKQTLSMLKEKKIDLEKRIPPKTMQTILRKESLSADGKRLSAAFQKRHAKKELARLQTAGHFPILQNHRHHE